LILFFQGFVAEAIAHVVQEVWNKTTAVVTNDYTGWRIFINGRFGIA
jgi:hypothetical protein